jgi:DNA-binding transcriptional ArsR family regulator
MCTDAQTEEHRPELPTAEQVEVAVGTLRMLAEPTRLRVLWLLAHGEESVGRLAELAGVAPSVVSQHLGKLRLARLVTTRRDGNRIFYAATDVHVRQLVEEALFHADHLVAGIADHEPTR